MKLSICINKFTIDSTAAGGPSAALRRAFAIFITKDMLMLSVTSFYTGLLLTYWSGVYGPSIGKSGIPYTALSNIFDLSEL